MFRLKPEWCTLMHDCILIDTYTLKQMNKHRANDGVGQWVWVEMLNKCDDEYAIESAYYKVLCDHTGGRSFCFGYRGWSAHLDYVDYKNTWIALRINPSDCSSFLVNLMMKEPRDYALETN